MAAAALVLCFGAAAVYAEGENTLIISYEADGAEFDIYKAGEFTEANTFYLSGDFADYAESVNLSGLTSSGWAALAETLYNYAVTDSMTPLASGTISGGEAEFTGLDRGLYLVSPSTVTTGGYTYTSETFLVCLPNLTEDLEWTSTVTVSPKFTKESDGGGGGTTAEEEPLTLLVVWVNDTEDVRPDEVVYTIYRDGEVYTTVTLSEENNWQYELTGLDPGYTWTAAQADLPEGYTTTIESDRTDEGTEIVITNTYEEAEETTEAATEATTEASETTTKAPSTPSGGGGGGGDSYVIGGESTTEAVSDNDTEATTAASVSEGSGDEGDSGGDTGSDGGDTGSDDGEKPGESEPYTPGKDVIPGGGSAEVDNGEDTDSDSVGSGESLPQTGQLWLPVPILVFCGLVLFIIGYIRFKRNENES